MLIPRFEWKRQCNIFALVEDSVHPSNTLDGANLITKLFNLFLHVRIKSKGVLTDLEWDASTVWNFHASWKLLLKILEIVRFRT